MNKTKRRTLFAVLVLIIVALSIKIATTSECVSAEPELIEVIKPVYIQQEQPISAVSLGEFEITYYTAGPESTGKTKSHPAYGITKSGATVWEGVTVAVDPDVIPLGSYLYIEGIGFRVAQDTGGAIKGKAIDVYVPDVETARKGGRHSAKVYIIKEEESNVYIASNDRR